MDIFDLAIQQSGEGSDPEPPSGSEDLVGAELGSYRLVEEIGRGGFGVVFRAEQLQPVQRKVALKLLKAGMDTDEVVARFEAERQALAMMEHPGIAKVFDAGMAPSGRSYFVMEFVDGVAINRYADTHQMDVRSRLQLFIDVCRAVQHAHQKGVIHRDLKPANILVAEGDGGPEVKVIDFGVAKAIGQELTQKTLFTGQMQVLGTPQYMSPEQSSFGAADVDTRIDIYALGVVLYELLTGHTPIDRKTLKKAGVDEVLRMIREQEPKKPSTRLSSLQENEWTKLEQAHGHGRERLIKQVRGDLDWIVMKAIAKERERRYESASALGEDLRNHLDGKVVAARPPSFGYRFGKFVGRNRRTLIPLTAIALILGFSAISLAVASSRSREKDRQIDLAKTEQIRTQIDATRTAFSGGAWEDTVKSAQSVLASHSPLVDRDQMIQMHLWRIEAFAALGDLDNARSELEVVWERYPDLGDYMGALILWRSGMGIGEARREEGYRAEVQRALDTGLDGADRHYARALAAETIKDSLEELRKAIELEPFHYRSNALLCHVLTLIATHPEATIHIGFCRRLYPKDKWFAWSEFVENSLKGTEREAMQAKQALEAIGGIESIEAAEAQIEGLTLLGTEIRERWDGHVAKGQQSAIVRAMSIAMSAARGKNLTNILSKRAPILETIIEQDVNRIRSISLDRMSSLVAAVHLSEGSQASVEALGDAVEGFPTALMSFQFGVFQQFYSLDGPRARQSFLAAAELPCFVRGFDQEAIYATVMSLAIEWVAGEFKDDAIREEILQLVRRRWDMGPMRHSLQADHLARIARRAGIPELGRAILFNQLNSQSDDPDLHLKIAEFEATEENPALARKHARLVIASEAGDKLKDKARSVIAGLLESQGE